MKKSLCPIISGFVLTLIFAIQGYAATINISDMEERKVKVPFDPDKIVCIGPGTLRLIVYLQAEDKVAGVEDMEKDPEGRPYWIAHPELHDLPRCGPGGPAGIGKKPDLEAIMNIYPDVIFITYMDAAMADEVQATLGIPVVVLSYGSLGNFDEKVYDSLRLAGKILNRERRAGEVINYIEDLRKDLNQRTGDVPESRKQGVFVGGIGYRGSYGMESTEKDYIPLDWVSAHNLAKQVEGRIGTHVFVDKETLLLLDPDIIFIDSGGSALVEEDYRKKRDFYDTLRAFKNRQVFMLLPFNYYTTNIETALADAYAIAKILYIDNFKDIDPEEKADEIYTFMVGKPVYHEMKKDFGRLGVVAQFLDGFSGDIK
jgi:iron complex transport system substrate-binding protein